MNKIFKSRALARAACTACTLLLPFFLVDELQIRSTQSRGSNSVFTNALRFYAGERPKEDRYIAIVSYIGLEDGLDPEAVRSSVNGIIENHVTPAFEKKGLRFNYNTNQVTDVRLFYNKDTTRAGVAVFCFVTSIAAFALVVA
jgi:hypothetical protein